MCFESFGGGAMLGYSMSIWHSRSRPDLKRVGDMRQRSAKMQLVWWVSWFCTHFTGYFGGEFKKKKSKKERLWSLT